MADSNRQMADLLRTLAEVDARRLHRDQGCSSLFKYCVERLGFSEAAAYKRITAARLSRSFPAVLDCVARGDLHLTPRYTRASGPRVPAPPR